MERFILFVTGGFAPPPTGSTWSDAQSRPAKRAFFVGESFAVVIVETERAGGFAVVAHFQRDDFPGFGGMEAFRYQRDNAAVPDIDGKMRSPCHHLLCCQTFFATFSILLRRRNITREDTFRETDQEHQNENH